MPVSDLALDTTTGDLRLERGEVSVVDGADAIAQDWRLRLTLFEGEWVLDRRVGIDYQNQVFSAPPGRVLLRHIFETVTRETAGVSSVDRLELALDAAKRELAVSAQVTANTGETAVLILRDVLFGADA